MTDRKRVLILKVADILSMLQYQYESAEVMYVALHPQYTKHEIREVCDDLGCKQLETIFGAIENG